MSQSALKRWLLPGLAVGVAIFLMSRRGRSLQHQIRDRIDDWSDDLVGASRDLQSTLSVVQSAVEHFTHAVRAVNE